NGVTVTAKVERTLEFGEEQQAGGLLGRSCALRRSRGPADTPHRDPRFIERRPRLARKGWEFNVSTPCPQFDSKEMTMTPTEWLILIITTSVVVIVFGVWFYRLTH